MNHRQLPALASAVLAGALLACAPDYGTAAQDDAIKLDSEIVTVDVSLTDAKGNYVTDLKQAEIRLFEDNQPREIAFFGSAAGRELSRPVAAVIALDTSGSIRPDEVALQREAAMQFMQLVRPESLFSVVAFSHEFKVLQKFTSDPKEIGKGFGKVSSVGGSTRILDAVDESITRLRKAPSTRSGKPLRRVVVLITDGYDNSSVIEPAELIRRAAAANVTVYSITLPSYFRSSDGGRPQRALTILDASRVVALTGGLDFSADSSDFTPMFRAIAEQITASYQLAFYPPEAVRRDGRFHELRVEVSRPGLTVHASRRGYVATRQE